MFPGGLRVFRKNVTAPDVVAVDVVMTADDNFSFFADGKPIYSAPTGRHQWRLTREFNFPVDRTAQSHLFAVSATNAGRGLAGLIGVMNLRYGNGLSELIPTDGSWIASAADNVFMDPQKMPDSSWRFATVAGYQSGQLQRATEYYLYNSTWLWTSEPDFPRPADNAAVG